MKQQQSVTWMTALACDSGPGRCGRPEQSAGNREDEPLMFPARIVDMFYTNDDTKEGIGHVKEEIAGFSETPGIVEEHEHAHGTEEGFNLCIGASSSAAVDPYFKGSAIAAIDLEGAELEIAEVETTSLPLGFHGEGWKIYTTSATSTRNMPTSGILRTRPWFTSSCSANTG